MFCKHIVSASCRNFSKTEILTATQRDKVLDYDIIISGGGMIGSTLACVLSRNPLLRNRKILLIEGMAKKNWSLNKDYSNRVSALSTSTKKLLESIKVWNHIKEARFKPVKKMKVWGSSSQAMVEFSGDKSITNGAQSFDDVAYIVENDVLVAAVNRELEKVKDAVTVIYGSKVQRYTLPKSTATNDTVSIEMEDGRTYSCSLLLGTDGANSRVRQTMGAEYVNWSYGQSAIVATMHLEEIPRNEIAWQRFLASGPVALLPLNENTSSLVWSTWTEDARQLMQTSDEEFVNTLNNALIEPPKGNAVIDYASWFADSYCKGSRMTTMPDKVPLKPPTVKGLVARSRASFPLGFGHSSSYVMPSVALLGDAAHRVHPLAGQGVNLGFGDITTLNRLLSDAVLNGCTINSFHTLKQYEAERLRQNLPTMLAIDLINKLYSSSNTALMTVGHFAIQFANSLLPIKNIMMRRAGS